MRVSRCWVAAFLVLIFFRVGLAEDGYRLWLRYDKVPNAGRLAEYRGAVRSVLVEGKATGLQAARSELEKGLKGLLGQEVMGAGPEMEDGMLIVGTADSDWVSGLGWGEELKKLGPEGYVIRSAKMAGKSVTVIASAGDFGTMYGVFRFLRLMQTDKSLANLDISETPRIQRRILSHWDNTPGASIERGYAGESLWKWDELPAKVDDRIWDYARANASIGINGAILNNVNTTAAMLEAPALQKWAALADVLRRYGIRIYLTAKYSAPMDVGGLSTCDPLDPAVREWWRKKADEIYGVIPDFGGLEVKADSEGQPGPLKYGRTHADGANMFAEALAPHGGVVLWRAFVYSTAGNHDRALDGYAAFKPLDGKFAKNVFVSVKNGPIDFQPREPFHPLFGAMPGTPLLLELEITQEYIGHQMHLVYLGEQWEEFFRSDTYAKGTGSTTEKVVDGSLFGSPMTGILGTANTGTDRNWCGHDFAQANWYAFGRFAWNPGASTDEIADDWVRMTWSNDDAVVKAIKSMMMGSWETFIRYDCPLGLPFLQQLTSHYNPDPKNRTKFIGLDETGIGLDRTESGNNMVGEYFPEARGQFLDMNDLRWLLWFHHVEWGQKLATGRTLWDELCWQYDEGVHGAEGMQAKWEAIKGSVDDERWQAVAGRLSRQVADGKDWRDYCLRFFHTYSRIPLPADVAEQGPMEPPKAKKDQEP